jgi:hypothetical protein
MNRPNINYYGPDWGLVELWLGEDLKDSFHRLANRDCSEKEADQLRGRIMLLQQMLDFRSDSAADRPLV